MLFPAVFISVFVLLLLNSPTQKSNELEKPKRTQEEEIAEAVAKILIAMKQ